MSYKSTKRMFMWDLKEIDNLSQQSLSVEPFNLWPSGNCGHVYSSSHTQAKRHISGWAMRNTNNHNINILKKSCLGVLVCNRNCRKTDGNVVAVRPAICDKARRKQIGRKCPNGCGGVLVMQQCKGHSGYPVTHFWRHHEDKVFFLGKGYHDHPRPELKLSSEKRKSYIRQPKKMTGQMGMKVKYSGASTSALRMNTTCKYNANITRVQQQVAAQQAAQQVLNTSSLLRNYQHQMAAGPGLYSPPPYPYHALNYNAISSAFQPDPSASRLVVPECDYYFPSINQEYTVNNQVGSSFALPEFKTAADTITPYSHSSTASFREPTSVLSPAVTTYPLDYSIPNTLDFCKQAAPSTAPNFYRLSYNDAGESILDLSVPTSAHLDSSWQSDPHTTLGSSLYQPTKAPLPSFLSPTLPAIDTELLSNNQKYGNLSSVVQSAVSSQPSTATSASAAAVAEATQQLEFYKMREEVPMRFKALWDSIYPLSTSSTVMTTSQPIQTDSHRNQTSDVSTAVSSVFPYMPESQASSSTSNEDKQEETTPDRDALITDMMEIDDLDMGDISNIISGPLPKPTSKSAPPPENSTESAPHQQPPQTLPTLSSFLRGIDYL